jgi:predicted acyltransferase
VPDRFVAVDVMRGLVILVLVPDIHGAFGLYRMAERFPDDPLWSALAGQSSHAVWVGAHLWDFVMPAFVFLVGIGIHLSHAARSARGYTHGSQLVHATMRATALVLLGLMLGFPVETWADQLWPYVVIGIGFPLAELMERRGVAKSVVARVAQAQTVAGVPIVLTAAFWVASRLQEVSYYDLNNILVQIGLAYLPAFAVVRLPSARLVAVALGILVVYATFFFAYGPPPGATPNGGQVFGGLAAHWNNGTNAASAFDRWLLNLLPRATPYIGNPLGAHTLQCLALVPTMIGGILAARAIVGAGPCVSGLRPLNIALAGAACALLGLLVSLGPIPLVKWLWTPSWALFSLGVCTVLLALIAALVAQVPTRRAWNPLIALGTNSILLYTIAVHDRWRILGVWHRVAGDRLAAADAAPLIEALLMLVTLWAFAYILFRARIFLRL